MDDRTTVNLYVHKSQAEKAESLFAETPDDGFILVDLVCFCFDEVNYGNLHFLNDLRDAGIAYNSSWEAGHEFTAGTAYCRFSAEGDCIEKEVHDDGINPDLELLLERIDKPADLRNFILAHKESKSVPELDEYQVEYGKIYQMKKLISPG